MFSASYAGYERTPNSATAAGYADSTPIALDTVSTITPYFVTLVLPRSSTTYTTTFDLATTATDGAIFPQEERTHHGLTGSQIGGIVGGAVGFVTVLILFCCCCDFTGGYRRSGKYGSASLSTSMGTKTDSTKEVG